MVLFMLSTSSPTSPRPPPSVASLLQWPPHNSSDTQGTRLPQACTLTVSSRVKPSFSHLCTWHPLYMFAQESPSWCLLETPFTILTLPAILSFRLPYFLFFPFPTFHMLYNLFIFIVNFFQLDWRLHEGRDSLCFVHWCLPTAQLSTWHRVGHQ